MQKFCRLSVKEEFCSLFFVSMFESLKICFPLGKIVGTLLWSPWHTAAKIIICFNFAHSKKTKQLMCCTNTNGCDIPGPSTNIDGLQMCSWTLNKPVWGCNERKNLSLFVPYFGYFGVPLKGQTPVQVLYNLCPKSARILSAAITIDRWTDASVNDLAPRRG